jgi:hypothetical protein
MSAPGAAAAAAGTPAPPPPSGEAADVKPLVLGATSKETPPHLAFSSDGPPLSVHLKDLAYLKKLGTKLNRENLAAWEARVNSAFMAEDLMKYVLGAYPLDPSWSHSEKVMWTKIDKFLISVLLGNMTDEFTTAVSDYPTSAEVWSATKAQFGISGSLGFIAVLQKMINTRFEDGDDVLRHISTFRSFRRELNLLRKPLDDENLRRSSRRIDARLVGERVRRTSREAYDEEHRGADHEPREYSLDARASCEPGLGHCVRRFR